MIFYIAFTLRDGQKISQKTDKKINTTLKQNLKKKITFVF